MTDREKVADALWNLFCPGKACTQFDYDFYLLAADAALDVLGVGAAQK